MPVPKDHVDPRPSAFAVARPMGIGAIDAPAELVQVMALAISAGVELNSMSWGFSHVLVGLPIWGKVPLP